MSKNRTRNTPEPQPMDSTAKEGANPGKSSHSKRVCYAVKTLVAEVTEMFPETGVSYDNYDGRNTALDVTFDASMIDADERPSFVSLLELVSGDERVADVVVEEDAVLVSFVSSARTQDLRDPFRLDEAWEILTEGVFDEADGAEWDSSGREFGSW